MMISLLWQSVVRR